MNIDKSFIVRAIEIAREGIGNGGGPFGAVVTKGGEIISEAYNRVVLGNDPTAHAEIIAIREAGQILKTPKLNDCTLYSSCEPCPMCLGAIYWSGIKKIVYASNRKDAEEAGFSDKMIYDEMELDPSSRRLSFIQIDDSEAKDLFRLWDQLDNKIPY